MRCPYLGKRETAEGAEECHAREGVFEPSFQEVEQYCTSRLHLWCPLYQQLRSTPTGYRAGKRRYELQRAIGYR